MPSFRVPELPKLFKREKIHYKPKRYQRVFSVQEMFLVIAATLLFMAGILLPVPRLISVLIYAAAAILAFLPRIFQILQDALNRKLPEEDLLVLLGIIGGFCIGEEVGAAIAAILYRLAQVFEAYAVARADAAIDLMRDKLPEKAKLLIGDKTSEVMPETVDPGQIVRVGIGETVPLDGVIVSGVTELDLSILTGNSTVHTCGVGDQVFSGSVNHGAVIDVRVTKPFSESAAASLLRDVQDAARYETTQERLSDRICAWFAPVVGVLALLLLLVPSLITGQWLPNLRRAVLFLLAASPSALMISVSLSCLGGEMSGIFNGIVSKGHDCLEILAQTRTMVFGKTGTITGGRFEITGVFPNGCSAEDLLAIAAAAESYSRHPIAQLLKLAANWTPDIAESVLQVEEIPGRGVSAFIEGRHVYVGNAYLLQEHGIRYAVPSRAGSAVHVAVENRYWGHILVTDKTREGAFDALEELRSQGVQQLVMLTGDVLSSSRPLASSLGFDLLRTELTPEAKVSAIRYLISGKGKGTSVGFVGDGINDVPMLEAADVGLAIDALHAWNEADAADILLLDRDIEKLPAAMRIARGMRLILWENVGILSAVKCLVLLLALFGSISIPAAAFLGTVSTALAMINSLRSFGLK
ncbi:MAG: cadmium-translocating P-type ATPase [Oscillospiraceae bacterium]|nr:cadmium-translocating P-type ATPase [Oscillospiraceae bacterium]